MKKINKKNNESYYKDEGKHCKLISNKHFIHDIERIHPLSVKYRKYWEGVKRRCMEGYWYEGKWMPGPLYFYVNLCKIRLNKNEFSTTKIVGRPWLRDLEWEKAYVLMEARGFSGFEKDDAYTCWSPIETFDKLDPEEQRYIKQTAPKEVLRKDGSFKTYVRAREYLRKIHTQNYGKPLFQNEASNVIDIECRGGGKDLEENTLLHYTDGSKRKIKNVRVGDEIFGKDGKPTKVTERRDFKNQMQYEVTLADNRKVTCGGGHLWTVFFRGKIKTLTLDEIRKSYYWERTTGIKDYKYALPINDCVEYTGEDPDIDPYFLGLWLGDGNSHNCGITTMDEEIVNFLKELKEKENLSVLTIHKKEKSKAATYVLSNGRGVVQCNPLKEKLKDLNLINNKHVPKKVLNASEEYRLAVVQGLMDSDGYVDKSHIELCTSYKGLQETIPDLLRGLGIKILARTKKTTGKDTLRISLHTDKKLFRLSRKLEKVSIPSKDTVARREKVKIVDIKEVGIKPSVCIAVDNKDSLFLIDDFVVTHNSFWGANGMILHTWLMDGVYDYDEYLLSKELKDPYSVDVMVGAIDGKYTKELLDKVSLGLDNLVGEDERNGIYYPPPLLKKYQGSWHSGKQFIENKYKIKKGNDWQVRGTGSKIYHRSFKDDPHAGNGIRTSLGVIEEVGFFNCLEESLGHMKDTTYDGTRKFGTLYMFGTGGDMEGGSSEAAMQVFNNPAEYDCLCFDDVWEESGSIGYFVPYEKGLNQFKDKETGVTNEEHAKKFVDRKREKLKKGKNKGPLYREMQNNPRVPSEAFLTMDSNIFPVGELKEHLNWLRSHQQDSFVKGQCGELIYTPDESGQVHLTWKPDLKDKLTPCGYKMKKSDDTTGCIQIWEHPKTYGGTTPPHGLYIAGTDPYDQDQAENTASLGSTFIFKTFYTEEGIYEWPVAEYSARPKTAAEHHENIRRLLLYYNAIDMYENERNTLKMHFSHKHSLYLLAKTPTILKATENSTVQRQYGIHMTKQIKNELEIYTRDWLLEEAGDGRLNLHKIYSIPLLEELIYYNDTGNFDRVIAFMLAILHRLQNHHMRVTDKKEEDVKNLDTFLNRIERFYK